MTVRTILRKRRPMHPREIGLFADHEIADEDLQLVPLNQECMVTITTPKSLDVLKYLWALATMVSRSVEGLYDREDGMDYLKTKARFVKAVWNERTKKTEFVPKSMRRLSDPELRRLMQRMQYVVLSQVCPRMKEGELKRELIKMCGGGR